MQETATFLTFRVAVTAAAQRMAEKFRSQQPDAEKGEQVYRNTLAVWAVNFYCRCMGIETDMLASNSWDFAMQSLADTADLEVKNLGKIECRPVLAGSQVVKIPAEVWSDRIGYIAVQFNEAMSEAELLGFVKEVAAEELPLSAWRSLDDFLERISTLKQAKTVNLSQWLENVFEAGWETVEALFRQQYQLASGFRSGDRFRAQMPSSAEGEVKRGKLLDLQRSDEKVALFVGLIPTPSPEMDIWVELYPTDTQMYLPQDIYLSVLDEEGKAVMQAEARGSDNVRFRLKGEPGERFGVKVALGDVIITEEFII